MSRIRKSSWLLKAAYVLAFIAVTLSPIIQSENTYAALASDRCLSDPAVNLFRTFQSDDFIEDPGDPVIPSDPADTDQPSDSGKTEKPSENLSDSKDSSSNKTPSTITQSADTGTSKIGMIVWNVLICAIAICLLLLLWKKPDGSKDDLR